MKKQQITEKEAYEIMAPRIAELRGSILNEVVYLERLMDEYLCRHFCSDKSKRLDLLSFLMATDRITFDNKRGILKILMERDNKPFVLNNKSIFSDLETIMKERNFLAHTLFDSSLDGYNSFLKNEFKFIRFKNSIERSVYNDTKMKNISRLIAKYIDIFTELLEQ